ncbi:MAG TPA: fused MFS/spermidine synthase, partial [Candidatus Methylomirabilis sp.]|nr:fused MFS/spermidine synthase [Candidatus Methylomirabilis sp.]
HGGEHVDREVAHKPRTNAWLLHAVVFVCGAVLMGLEIVGSRILAPYFGNSIFVWGSLISVVLAALSLGYWLGGMVADRFPRLSVMGGLIALPGVMIALLPFIYPPLNGAIAASDLGARLSPLLSSLLLFLVPSVCLGTISPFAVRLQAKAVASVGTTAGGLYAVSTAGSIAGTLLTAFYLIAVVGVANIVHGLGLTLLLLAAVIFVGGRRFGRAVLALGCAGLVLLGLVWRTQTLAADPGLLLDTDSFYNHIRVAEDSGTRYMDFDNLRQSAMLLKDPWELRLRYTRFLALALTFQPSPKRVLILGLGGGSFPKRLHHDFPQAVVDVADIDPKVVAVAKRYFQVPEDDRLHLIVQDGRRFVRETKATYDLIFLDAYNSDTIPFHLTTREFYQELKARLAPGGVVVSNIIGSLRGPESAFFRAMYRTLADGLPTVYVIPTYGGAGEVPLGEINIILIATQDKVRLTRAELMAKVGQVGGKLVPASDLAEYASHLLEIPVDVGDVPILTDDYAPVEILRAS